jgi:acetaldehyde dehydrogenase (acetylating)
VHSQNDDVILEFGLKKPAFRICVNTPTTHGSIGLTTGLDPAMTLGCGGAGGNSTSDNISPRHLLNLKRVAYGIRPAVASPGVGAAATGGGPGMPRPASTMGPQAPVKPVARGISTDELRSKVDQFLTSRGYRVVGEAGGAEPASAPPAGVSKTAPVSAVAFVCEDDVRQAIRAGTTIALGEKTIVTPAARDLGQAHNVFAPTSWPR